MSVFRSLHGFEVDFFLLCLVLRRCLLLHSYSNKTYADGFCVCIARYWSTVHNVTAVVGAGVLGLPYAMKVGADLP